MKILVTGFNGYLARGLMREMTQHEIVLYDHDVRDLHMYDDIDMLLHFACPSDKDGFKDRFKTSTTIIDGTLNMLKIAQANNCKFVYASTLGVISPHVDDVYCVCKSAMDNYIQCVYNNYIILRIPRVYSRCRQKGLMKQIRDKSIPKNDYNKVVNFITLDSFVKQTIGVLAETNLIKEYDVDMSMPIGDIEKWILG